MGIKVRAHFDGKVIVPDEPVDLPVDEPIEAELTVVRREPRRSAAREAAWKELLSRRIPGLNIPDEALRRENLYEDRL